MPEAIKPALQVKEISDIYLRRNFESLQDFFKTQNQLVDFKFLDVAFTGVESNRKIFHGLGRVPADLLRLSMTGSGVITFTRSLFDQNYLYLTSTGACRVRFFAGNYFGAAALGNFETEETEQWFSQAPASLTTGADGFPIGGFLTFPNATPPAKFLLCNASLLLAKPPYYDLFKQLGTQFNISGDPNGSFRLPGPNGRVLMHAGLSTANGATTHTVGQTGGEETHTQLLGEVANHTHTMGNQSDDGMHDTSMNRVVGIGASVAGYGVGDTNTGRSSGLLKSNLHTHTVVAAGSSTPFNVLSPYLCIGYLMVKYLA